MEAFAAPVSLRLVRREKAVCELARLSPLSATRCCPVLSLSTPSPPTSSPRSAKNKGKSRRGINAPQSSKRVATYKKLQRRELKGLDLNAQSEEGEQKEVEASSSKERTSEKHEKDSAEGKEKENRTKRKITLKLSDVFVGQKLSGVVRNTVQHGAYVNVGTERDGLVHLRDMSVDFVHVPTDLLRDGDTVDVWVKYVDPVKKVLGLTMVKPHLGFESRMKVTDVEVGGRYHGVIERVTNYGAYLDIGAERHAFLHVTGLWGDSQRDTLDFLRLGEKAWVHVVDIDVPKSHVRLWARARGGHRLSKTNEVSQISLQARMLEVRDHEIPNPTRRSWEPESVVEHKDKDSEEEIEENSSFDRDAVIEDGLTDQEFSFVEDMDTWFNERGNSVLRSMNNVQEISHMLDENTEFVDEDES
ncbi:unnamed protein product [Agarophyton chilense]|eukprot:gb/GEZJ01003206.1/.p1 GENE.gb/GEZJ01003206.1/~~gb/GEZJ01003206.1/.p1  ORF type:complete len:416 (+),score=62.04 gb/GEZJ01003206.1/:176-1423(+)